MKLPAIVEIEARLKTAPKEIRKVVEYLFHPRDCSVVVDHLISGPNFKPSLEFLRNAPADIAALLAEVKRLTAENDLLKKSIDLLTPPEHPTVAECANTITGVAGGEDGD